MILKIPFDFCHIEIFFRISVEHHIFQMVFVTSAPAASACMLFYKLIIELLATHLRSIIFLYKGYNAGYR